MRSDGEVCKLGIEHSSCICHFLSFAMVNQLVILLSITWLGRLGTRKVAVSESFTLARNLVLKDY